MPIQIRGDDDVELELIRDALAAHLLNHPKADIVLYRRNNVSIRIRMIDQSFKGLDRATRHDQVWSLLEKLPDEVIANISFLLLLAPAEAPRSIANMDFDDPVPSALS